MTFSSEHYVVFFTMHPGHDQTDGLIDQNGQRNWSIRLSLANSEVDLTFSEGLEEWNAGILE